MDSSFKAALRAWTSLLCFPDGRVNMKAVFTVKNFNTRASSSSNGGCLTVSKQQTDQVSLAEPISSYIYCLLTAIMTETLT